MLFLCFWLLLFILTVLRSDTVASVWLYYNYKCHIFYAYKVYDR